MCDNHNQMDIYREMGYQDRQDYLQCLADEYDLPCSLVKFYANMLGPPEDFDGLIITLEDDMDFL